jgi:phosphatidylglycerol:prolipoprotein diacylglycerol transferase
MAPAIALGVALTRVGCFLSGCCYGRETTCGLGVAFPADSPAGAYAARLAAERGVGTVCLHPSQLYDSFLALATVIVLFALQRKLVKRGATFGLMLLCYGTSRFVVDFFRVYEANMKLGDRFNLNQLVSLCLVLAGVALMLRKTDEKTVFHRRRPKS